LCVPLLSAAGFASLAAAQDSAPAQSAQIAKQADAWFESYKFRDGETIARLRIHYATLGQPHRNADGNIDNAVLVLHWTGADGLALLSPTYMEALYDVGRPLDARRYYLIFPDNVGHGQSSKPSDGLKAKFPNYGYRDIVDLQHKLVAETLGINHLHSILGMSMGGMNAWQWAEAYPDAMDGVMPVVSLPIKVSGRNMLWRRMVINDIRSDPEWNGGNYTKQPPGFRRAQVYFGIATSGGTRAIYNSAPTREKADKFIEERLAQPSAADANDVLYQYDSSRDYNPAPKLESIQATVLAINSADDERNPAELGIMEKAIKRVKHGRYVLIPTSDETRGHGTTGMAKFWKKDLAELLTHLDSTK
jgi:homoserine O-acetyltransferase